MPRIANIIFIILSRWVIGVPFGKHVPKNKKNGTRNNALHFEVKPKSVGLVKSSDTARNVRLRRPV